VEIAFNILEKWFLFGDFAGRVRFVIWRDSTKAETAAAAMKITPKDLKELGIVDEIVASRKAERMWTTKRRRGFWRKCRTDNCCADESAGPGFG